MVRRMMNPTASGLIRRWCEAKGVKILTRTQPKGLTANGGALQVDLGEGRSLPADMYLSVVGVDPNLEFLAGSGIEIGQGILVDANLQSSVPGVYAAGDVAESTDCLTGKRELNAIQPNAVEQGRIAALNMAGRPARFKGSFVFNVLTTLGLVSSSFGEWQGVPGGESAEVLDAAALSLPEPAVRRRSPGGRQLRGLLRARRRAARTHRGTPSAGHLEAAADGRPRADHAGLPLGGQRRMTITLKLFASLAAHLPAEARSEPPSRSRHRARAPRCST